MICSTSRGIFNEFHTLSGILSAETVVQVEPGSEDTSVIVEPLTSNADEKRFREPIGTYLQQYGRDLTQDAERGLLDPLVGRQDVLERVLQILLRRTKNNPCLIGDPGVGKTQIAEGVAQLIVSDKCPRALQGCSLVALDVGGLVSGTQYRGTFEEKIQGLLKEVRRSQGRILLFVDEIHMLMDTGKTEGGLNAANLLKPSLARGELHMIGATTVQEYRKHVETDAAFSRRLQPVMVQEPTPVECLTWLQGLRKQYEEHHCVKFTDDALTTAISAAERFVSERKLPDSAIDLLDEAASRVQLKASATNGFQRATRTQIFSDAKKDSGEENALSCPHCGTVAPVVSSQQLQIVCPKCRYRFLPIPQEKLILGASLFLNNTKEAPVEYTQEDRHPEKDEETLPIPVVSREDILHVAAAASGLPLNKVETVLSEGKALQQLSLDLKERLVGQENAINDIVNSLRLGTMLASTGTRKRPISMMIFQGDLGVGKKTVCKIISESLFGSDTAFISFDMSQYNDRTATSKLLGAAPGFIGYGDGGALTEAVRRNPHTVVLLENIEHAHVDVLALIRHISHQGYINDGMGQKVDFRNAIVIMTTKAVTDFSRQNLSHASHEDVHGASDTIDQGGQSSSLLELSERPQENSSKTTEALKLSELKTHVDKVVKFARLSKSDLRQIISKEIDSMEQILCLCGINSLSVDPEVIEYLFNRYSISNGHDAKTIVETHIIDPAVESYTSKQVPDKTSQASSLADIHVSLGNSGSTAKIIIDIE